jgi:hypothetical protein
VTDNHRQHQRDRLDAGDDLHPGRGGGVPVPAGLARDPHPGDRHPGITDRHHGRAVRRRLLCEHHFSLFALVLAITLVVDDAILVVENVTRNLEEYPTLNVAEATERSMREITGPVIATTLVLVAVFAPVGFLAGVIGRLYRQFAMTISTALVISAVNALTLSPALCALILRPPQRPRLVLFR